MAKIFANSEDPDQMPHSVASDLGLHCLPIIFLGVSRLQWVKRARKTQEGLLPKIKKVSLIIAVAGQ